MRTTLVIDDKLISEAKSLSGSRTKRETVEAALQEFIRRRKAKKLLGLEGKIELSYDLEEFLTQRRKDVPH